MIVDVVIWNDLPDRCNRCGRVSNRYIPPYWSPGHRICPACCRELERFHDREGWPKKKRNGSSER